jgi:WD40 repeat protein
MIHRSMIFSALLILVIGACACQSIAQAELPYTPAFLDYRDELEVFRSRGGAFTVGLPMAPSRIAYAPDGKSLYSFGDARNRARRGLWRIEFDPVRLIAIADTDRFRMVNGFALSLLQDIVVISGRYPDGDSSACGIFELDRQKRSVREIIENSTCDYPQSWVRLSLSPDSKRLVAYRKPRLELIDLATGMIRSLGEGYIAGAWSPDGKWLAVLESGGQNRTLLLDANSLTQKRVFGASNVQWSPDSRYLLGARAGVCMVDWASIIVIDVNTGQEHPIASSHCKVNLNTTGWVSIAKDP